MATYSFKPGVKLDKVSMRTMQGADVQYLLSRMYAAAINADYIDLNSTNRDLLAHSLKDPEVVRVLGIFMSADGVVREDTETMHARSWANVFAETGLSAWLFGHETVAEMLQFGCNVRKVTLARLLYLGWMQHNHESGFRWLLQHKHTASEWRDQILNAAAFHRWVEPILDSIAE